MDQHVEIESKLENKLKSSNSEKEQIDDDS